MNEFKIENIKKDIIEIKKLLRKKSKNYKLNFFNIEKSIIKQVEEIEELKRNNQSIIPEISFNDIENKNSNFINRVKKRGCVIIRNVFHSNEVVKWNQDLEKYINENDYFNEQKKKAGMDKYFSDLQSGTPQIFGLYWSKAQIEIRQSPHMAKVKSWLNNLWNYEIDGKEIFDPDRELVYADRVRRREAGDSTLGLSAHCDAGSVERWIDEAYHKIYKFIFSDSFDKYNPFDAQFRDQTQEIPSPAVSHVFRTFQGWTALTKQGPSDGTLKLIPISNSIGYVLTRALLDDVPEDELCGSQPARALSINNKYHSLLLRALISIPEVNPGDTVWWHPDVVHAVEDKHEGKDYSNVIYVGSTPYCKKNLNYSKMQAIKFIEGKSPPDFASEDYEINYKNRASIEDLTELGKKQMSLMDW